MFSEKRTLEEDYMRKDFINCPRREDAEEARRLGELSDLEASLTRIRREAGKIMQSIIHCWAVLGRFRKIVRESFSQHSSSVESCIS